MPLDEKAFTEEIDIFITEADEEAKELVSTAAENEEVTDDLSSEAEQEDEADGHEIFDEKTDYGSPGAETHEDGAVGDTSEAQGNEQEESAAPAISDYAMSRAASIGISPEHANEFSSGEALLAEVRYLEDRAAAPLPPIQKQVQEPEGVPQPVDPFADLPPLDPEEWEPKAIAMFDGLKDAMRSALQKQQDEMTSFREAQAASEAASNEAAGREVTQWFDSEVNKLPFDKALGSGGHGDQAPGSLQLAKRTALADQCAVLFAGYQASGQPTPTREEIFRTSARLVFADEYQSLHESEVSSGLKKQAGQHINRASGKKTKSTQSPEDETAALLDEVYSK